MDNLKTFVLLKYQARYLKKPAKNYLEMGEKTVSKAISIERKFKD